MVLKVLSCRFAHPRLLLIACSSLRISQIFKKKWELLRYFMLTIFVGGILMVNNGEIF